MMRDPIVEEIHRIREEYARQFDFDLHRIVADLQERQRRSGKTYIRRPPRRVQQPAAKSTDQDT